MKTQKKPKAIATEVFVEQGTEEWRNLRAGKATTSEFHNVMMAKSTKGYQEYLWRVALERVHKIPFESYKSKDMERGNELEATARLRHMLVTRRHVEVSGIFIHNELEVAASLDGKIGEDGIAEYKAPRRHNHGAILERTKARDKEGNLLLPLKQVPSDYKWQVVGQQWVSGRQWTDFASFSDEFPPNAALAIVRVNRDESLIEQLETRVREFLQEVEEKVQFILNYGKELNGEDLIIL